MHHNLPSSSGWFCITFLTALHASCMHCMQTCQDCVCCLKSKSLSDMCLPDPYPKQGFYEKEEVLAQKTLKINLERIAAFGYVVTSTGILPMHS